MISTRANGKWTIGMIVAVGLLILAGANAHMVYVAVTSQPDCVAHTRPGETAANGGSYSAAKSACRGGGR